MVSIRLDKKNKTIKVVNRKENIRLQHTRSSNVKLQHTGKVGPSGADGLTAYELAVENGFIGTEAERLESLVGPQGEVGQGVPSGGEEGFVLQKASDDDYDYQWMVPTFSDKTYTTNFYTTNEVFVNHGLGKYPAVSVIDSAGDEVIGSVSYENLTSLRVKFSNPFSGTVTCN